MVHPVDSQRFQAELQGAGLFMEFPARVVLNALALYPAPPGETPVLTAFESHTHPHIPVPGGHNRVFKLRIRNGIERYHTVKTEDLHMKGILNRAADLIDLTRTRYGRFLNNTNN